MSAYKITELYGGTFVLTIGDQLLIEASERKYCEIVLHALQNSTHAQRATQTGDIRDGIDVR